MTEPTGYTALDLVGFTDKGNYNAATAYVKNDLVHYLGDIWRCLIDDTTNITPVEGTNWTVFIEAPTNAIEGIIAPVETNPATDSYAVGRQFIYNDNLYIVLTAITAGDTLVAYEDDPSNANIQLADPVETQLLNFEEKAYSTDDSVETTLASDDLVPFYDTSAAAKKKMTVANMIGQTVSNPNLFDNPWFTVNQRGQSSYSDAGYTVDRWKRNASDANGHTLTVGSVTLPLNNSDFYQPILDSDCHLEANQTYTMSAIVDGNLYSQTFTAEGDGATHYHNGPLVDGLYFNIIENWDTGIHKHLFGINNIVSTQDHTITAIKLEVGSVSTLALDAAPNYATELLKCQRYFYRLSAFYSHSADAYCAYALGESISATKALIALHIPVKMRTIPTISQSGAIAFVEAANASYKAVTLTLSSIAENVLMLFATGTGLTIGNAGFLSNNNDANAYIDISADL